MVKRSTVTPSVLLVALSHVALGGCDDSESAGQSLEDEASPWSTEFLSGEEFQARRSCSREVELEDGRMAVEERRVKFGLLNYYLANNPELRDHAQLEQLSDCEDAYQFFDSLEEYRGEWEPGAEDLDVNEADATRESESDESEFQTNREEIKDGSLVGSLAHSYSVVVYLSERSDFSVSYQCSGVLISRTSLLTSAHCVEEFVDDGDDEALLYIRVGKKFSNDDEFRWVHSRGTVLATGIPHPKFSGGVSSPYDIAVVKAHLGSWDEVETENFVRVVKSPVGSLSKDFRAYGNGGHTRDGQFDGKERTATYTSDWRGSHHVFDDDDREYMCKGDSGGPAISNDLQDWPLVTGLFSNMQVDGSCTKRKGRQRWSSVSDYYRDEWIEEQVREYCHHFWDRSADGTRIDYMRCW